MRRNLVFFIAALFAVTLVVRVWAQPGKPAAAFQGYWMGVDPVDGGDARRSFVLQTNGTFALAARDSAFTLCDGTDRGFGSFDDGEVVGRDVMRSDSLVLECFNNGASVVLHVRYELLDKALMREVTTRADGTPVSTIIFHRIDGK